MTKLVIFVLFLLLLGVPAYMFFAVSASTAIGQPPLALGRQNELALQLSNPNGVRSVKLLLQQGGATSDAAAAFSAERFFFARKGLPPQSVSLKVSADPAHGFRSGAAKLTVEAVSNDLRAKTDTATYDVTIVLEPPRLQVDAAQHYVNQGGAELVTFTVSGSWSEAGVKIGPYRFRSYPLPGSKNPAERFSLFAFPWDVPASEIPVVYARDAAGQEVTAGFWFRLFPKKWRRRELPLNDAFLQKVTADLMPGNGDPLPRFLKINRETRKENNEALAKLRLQSEEKFLWSSPFEQLSNSQVEALFADIRSYTHQGQKVDEQVHLGFDLSKTAMAPVVAANSGRVVFAGPLGIYGNCVVIDHGYALQSIYGHMSSIGVKVNDRVERRQEIGRSGATGLAGGDHLHYSMQLDGVQINPLEWWDPHWIKDRIASKLPAGSIAGVAAK